MKIRYHNGSNAQLELSRRNVEALIDALNYGNTAPTIYKVIDGVTIAVSVVEDANHYNEEEL